MITDWFSFILGIAIGIWLFTRVKFCWHQWSDWSEAIESYGGSLHQVCKCKKCGAIKKRLSIHILAGQFTAGQINQALKEKNT